MRIATTLLVALAGTLLASPAAAEAPLPKVEKWTLPNGLQVAYVGVAKTPVVAVQMWYRAGSKDEPNDRRGLARLFQNLLFQGSERARPGSHLAYLAQVGGSATISAIEDATALQNVAPAQYFNLMMQLEADRMRGLEWRDEIVTAAVEQAQSELRRSSGDPLKRAVRPFLELAYPDHPYAWEAIGSSADLRKVSRADLESFYKTYYVPNNALLIVVGSVGRGRVEKAALEHFGGLAKAPAPPRPSDAKIQGPQTKSRSQTLKPSKIGVVMSGFHIPAAKHQDIYALQLLSIILGAGPDGQFSRDVVGTSKLAHQAGATAIVREHPGVFLTFASFSKPGTEAALSKAMLASVTKYASKGPSKRQMTTARNAILADFAFRIETVEGLASQIGMSWTLTKDPGQFIEDVPKLEAITAAEISRVVKKYVTPANMVTIVAPPAAR